MFSFFKKDKPPPISIRKTILSYPRDDVYRSLLLVLREDNYRFQRKDWSKGTVLTYPKENDSAYAKAFSGGKFRTTIRAAVIALARNRTRIGLSLFIEQEFTEVDNDSWSRKTVREWRPVAVREDRLRLLGDDTYENYFSRIERSVKKLRTGRLKSGMSAGSGDFIKSKKPGSQAGKTSIKGAGF